MLKKSSYLSLNLVRLVIRSMQMKVFHVLYIYIYVFTNRYIYILHNHKSILYTMHICVTTREGGFVFYSCIHSFRKIMHSQMYIATYTYLRIVSSLEKKIPLLLKHKPCFYLPFFTLTLNLISLCSLTNPACQIVGCTRSFHPSCLGLLSRTSHRLICPAHVCAACHRNVRQVLLILSLSLMLWS